MKHPHPYEAWEEEFWKIPSDTAANAVIFDVIKLKAFIRSLLEQDRKEQRELFAEKVKEMEFKMNVDSYLPLVKEWNGTNFDKPFDDGYRTAKESVLDLLQNNAPLKS